MIEQAVRGKYIQEDEQKTLIDWRKDPNAWAAKFTQTV